MKKPVKRKGYASGGTVSDTPPASWRPDERGPAMGPFGPMMGTSGPIDRRSQTWQQYTKDAASTPGKARGGKVKKVIRKR